MSGKQVITGYVDPSGKGEGNWSAEHLEAARPLPESWPCRLPIPHNGHCEPYALPEPQPLDDRLRYHPLTGDADFEEASLSDRLDVLIGHAESVGFHRGYAATLPDRPELRQAAENVVKWWDAAPPSFPEGEYVGPAIEGLRVALRVTAHEVNHE